MAMELVTMMVLSMVMDWGTLMLFCIGMDFGIAFDNSDKKSLGFGIFCCLFLKEQEEWSLLSTAVVRDGRLLTVKNPHLMRYHSIGK